MTDRLASALERLEDGSDPRLDGEHWRAVPAAGDRAAAIAVGVVHDHPASAYRVRAVVEAFDPDVVALELPELTIPHFRRQAAVEVPDVEEPRGDDSTPGSGSVAADGGLTPEASADEMTAAIAAAPDATVAGVDSVDWRFAATFARLAHSRGDSLSTVGGAVKGAWSVTKSAFAVRFGDDGDLQGAQGADHDVSPAADASAQAADERGRISRSRSLLGAVERPDAAVLFDEAREATMAAKVDAHRRSGRVVAVVGRDHLDSVVDALA
jgi:pheromone shutdown protein TraB